MKARAVSIEPEIEDSERIEDSGRIEDSEETEETLERDFNQRVEIYPGMFAQVVAITPALAAEWLKENHADNRGVTLNHIDGMAFDMEQPNGWRLTHEAIAFNGAGKLINGQHRLMAIVKSGVTVKILVIWNNSSDIHDPIDLARRRSLKYITGRENNTNAALGCLRGLELGHQVHAVMTPAASDHMTQKHGDAMASLRNNVQGYRKLLGGFIAACAWTLPIHEELVLDFTQKVSTGEMLQATDPAFVYRNWKERPRRGYTTWEIAMATFNCIRYHLHSLPLTSVFIGDSGYRAITAQRRVLKVPNTPGAMVVEGVAFRPQPEPSKRRR